MRLSLFTFKVIINEAPPILYSMISASDLDKDSKIGLTYEKRVFSLRGGEKSVSVNAISKFSRISFNTVFYKVKERCLLPNFDVKNIQKFEDNVCNKINCLTDDFCSYFPNFFFLIYYKFNFNSKKLKK